MRTVIPSGFKPVPGLDGLLAYGGAHETYVRFPDGRTIGPFPGACANWRGRDVATSRGVVLPSGGYGRDLVFVNVDTLVETPSGIDPSQNPGYFPQRAVWDDLIVSSANGQHYRSGQPIPTEPGAGDILDCDGVCILFTVQAPDGSYTTVVRDVRAEVDRHRIPGNLPNPRLDRVLGETWLAATGPAIWAPDGTKYVGPSEEACGPVTERFGQLMAITGLVDPVSWQPYWLVRPLAEWRAEVPFWKIPDIGHQGMVVSNDTAHGYVESNGELSVEPIPYDESRVTFDGTPVDPSEPDAGPGPEPEPEPEPHPPTHVITLEPGETLQVKCVAARSFGPMLRKVKARA